jgi:hypothetical protein
MDTTADANPLADLDAATAADEYAPAVANAGGY